MLDLFAVISTVCLGGSSPMPVMNMPAKPPPAAEMDRPDFDAAVLEMASQGERDYRKKSGNKRFTRKVGKQGKAGKSNRYKGGGLNLP